MLNIISCWLRDVIHESFFSPFRSRSFWRTRPLTLASWPSSVLCEEKTEGQIKSFNKKATVIWIRCLSASLIYVFLTCCCPLRADVTEEPESKGGGNSSQRRVRRLRSQRGRSEWCHLHISRKGGEGRREGGKGSCPIRFCVYLSKVTQTFAKLGFEWRPGGHRHAEETALGGAMGPGLAAVVHSWWQHQH